MELAPGFIAAVDGLATILGISFNEAQDWYKANGSNTEKAANAYFDNGGVLKIQVG